MNFLRVDGVLFLLYITLSFGLLKAIKSTKILNKI